MSSKTMGTAMWVQTTETSIPRGDERSLANMFLVSYVETRPASSNRATALVVTSTLKLNLQR